MSSLNKVQIIGNLGADPDIRAMQSGDEICNLSIATSETWKDKNTGERREKTEWHRIVIFNAGLVKVCKNYLKKGSKVYIEGQLETRSWEQDGQKKYATEIVLRSYRGEIKMLDSRNEQGTSHNQGQAQQATQSTQTNDPLEDDIPFSFILPLAATLMSVISMGGIV